ncbi:MAG: hypothetical protein N2258_02580 [Brevinematales bacterium]|nr:hypothetical protein [Brevinematales bacterium]
MRYSSILNIIFSFLVMFLIFSIFIYSLPFLIILAIILIIVVSVLWIINYFYNRIKVIRDNSKYDEEGLRKTKAKIINIKPSEEGDRRDGD